MSTQAILQNRNLLRMKYLLISVFLLSWFTTTAQDTTTINLMNLSLEDLMKIQVETAGKTSQQIADVPASMVVVSRSEIEAYGFHSLEEILQHVTGLFMTDDYYWLGTVNYGVRGFYSSGPFNNMVILVDGVNQMEEYTRGTPLSKVSIPVEAIERIEIVRGPMSVIYGSGAFLGAVNIITGGKNLSEAGVTYGNNNTKRAYAMLSRSSGDFSTTFVAGYSATDGPDFAYTELTTNPLQDNGKTFLENNGLANNARTTGQLSESRKHVSLAAQFDNLSFDLSYVTCRNGMMDGQPVLGEGSYFINNSFVGSAKWEKTINEELTLRARETFSFYNDYINYEQDYLNTTMGSSQLSSFFETEVNAIYTPAHWLDLLAGLHNRYISHYHWGGNYSYWGADYRNFLTRTRDPFYFNSAFVQATLRIGNHLSLVAGLRAEQMTRFTLVRHNDYDTLVRERVYSYDYQKINLIPRLAVLYQFNPRNTLKLFYGKAIKQPAMSDLQTYCLHPDWPTLKPAEISTWELNYINTVGDVLTTNFSIFHNAINNLITRTDAFNPDGSLTIQSTNSGKMNSTGCELRFIIKPARHLVLDLSGTWQESTDKTPGNNGIKPAYSPHFLGYGRLMYTFGIPAGIGLSWRYTDAMESYYDNTSIDPENPNLGKAGRIGPAVPAYHTLDLNLRHDNIWKGMYAELRVCNVFDTEIRYPTTTANIWIDKGALGLGRWLYVSAGVKF